VWKKGGNEEEDVSMYETRGKEPQDLGGSVVERRVTKYLIDNISREKKNKNGGEEEG